MTMSLEERGEFERLLAKRDECGEVVLSLEQRVDTAKGRQNDAHHAILRRVEQFIREAYNAGVEHGKAVAAWDANAAAMNIRDCKIVPAGTVIETHDEVAHEVAPPVALVDADGPPPHWAHQKNDKIVPYAGCFCETCGASRAVSEALRRQNGVYSSPDPGVTVGAETVVVGARAP